MAWLTLAPSLALLMVNLTAVAADSESSVRYFASLILGSALFYYGARLVFLRSRTAARQLLRASIVYLPLEFLTEGLVDTLDERRQIQVRRLLGAQGVKGRNLHLDLAMAAQRAQGFDVRCGDGARGADARQVIDHDRRIRESFALPSHGPAGHPGR